VDLSHKLTIGISSAALLVSAFVAVQTYRGAKIGEATTRAILHLATMKLENISLGGGEVSVVIENAGKALAKHVSVNIQPLVFSKTKDTSTPFERSEWNQIENIPPGHSITHVASYPLPTKPLPMKWPTLVVMVVSLSYTDEASGEEYFEQKTFSGIISGSKIVTPVMSVDVPPRGKELWDEFHHNRGRSSK
jgi:hypothetical protein